MPITINGNGTITGLSSGGLPAGSVTSATLANDVNEITMVDHWRMTTSTAAGNASGATITNLDSTFGHLFNSGKVWK